MHPDAERFTFVKCHTCALVFLNPRVPAAELARYYTPDYLPYRGAAAWGAFAPAVAVGLWAMDRRRTRLVRRFGGVGAGSRVLDVGCGRPTFLERLVRVTGAVGVGVDFSDAGWRGEADRFRDLDLRVQDARDLNPGDPVDLVTMWHYLEHDYAPATTLQRARACLRDGGGALIVEVPNHDSWTRRRHGSWWAGYHAPRHTALYTPETLAALLEGSGWRVDRILPYGTMDAYVLHWMSRMERRGIDWSAPMAARFPGFLMGKLTSSPRFALERVSSMGVMTAVARPA